MSVDFSSRGVGGTFYYLDGWDGYRIENVNDAKNSKYSIVVLIGYANFCHFVCNDEKEIRYPLTKS